MERLEKVYFSCHILERPSIGQYWNIFGATVLFNLVYLSGLGQAGIISSLQYWNRDMVQYSPIHMFQYLGF